MAKRKPIDLTGRDVRTLRLPLDQIGAASLSSLLPKISVRGIERLRASYNTTIERSISQIDLAVKNALLARRQIADLDNEIERRKVAFAKLRAEKRRK